MRRFGLTFLTLSLNVLLATACSLPRYGSATPTATVRPKARTQTAAAAAVTAVLATPTIISATSAVPPILTATFPPVVTAALPPVVTSTSRPPQPVTQAPPANFCADGQATALITSFKSALQTSNGALLASLVSPTHGMDARLYRNGRVVNYDQQHAKFLFETTFVVDWGAAPGSGLETKGSFHEVIIPALLDVFSRNYTLTCNQVQVGGTTYQATWPYTGINFYSVYFQGTQANGNMDWHTWLLGMHYVNGKPYLYAIMQFQWEP